MTLAKRLDAAIDAALGSRIVGCVVLVSAGGKRVYARAAGFADREAGIRVVENTVFRLASITKPIVASTALRMIDLGLLSLDDKVATHLPYFTPLGPDGSHPDITVRHLLTHTSGLTYDIPADVSRGSDPRDLMPLTENLRRLARAPLAFMPGTQWSYGMSIDVLGGVLAAVNRSDLEAVVAKYVTDPVGMPDTHFFVTDRARLSHPYGDSKPEPIRMAEPQQMHNDPANPDAIETFSPKRILQKDAPQSGGSGMAGTAGDFLRLLDALQKSFLNPATRGAAFSNQIGDLPRDVPGQRFGFLGGVIADAAASGWPQAGALQWGGIWGNCWILDPVRKLNMVVYTNTMREGCNGPFRDEIRDGLYG
ncbi:MAG: serine hydrolase domain-containing protein [Devosia sp.]